MPALHPILRLQLRCGLHNGDMEPAEQEGIRKILLRRHRGAFDQGVAQIAEYKPIKAALAEAEKTGSDHPVIDAIKANWKFIVQVFLQIALSLI